jgi:Domain of unknown function (DUF4365)
MTEDQQKEAISRVFLRLLASGHGFKVIEPPQDHGVDMIVCPVTVRREPSGRVRYLDSQYKLDFQLKSTTTAGIIDEVNQVKFDLEVKTFNDLVQRRADPLPLHLLVVVLTDPPPNCIYVDHQKLTLLGSAYWYLPDEDAQPSQNQQQVRISIPKTNRVESHFVRQRFAGLGIDL